uniref:Exocyst subunit Exo70 family protein n=1 Tax=Davidia involucrata TaxID=16924 RepID=A0A5B7B2L3_DAVIN
MEKNPPEKSDSFTDRNGFKKNDVASPRTPSLSSIDEKSDAHDHQKGERENIMDEESLLSDQEDHNIDQVSQDIDRFTDSLTTIEIKSNPPEVPAVVETFSKIVESRIAKYYNSGRETRMKFGGKMTEEDAFFIEAVLRISKLTKAFSEFPSSSTSTTISWLNRTSMVLQKAMSFLEEEFRALLLEDDSPRTSINNNNININVANWKCMSIKQSSSFNSKEDKDESDRCALPTMEAAAEIESTREEEEESATYKPELVTKLKGIVTTMISAGYETECCQVYSITRRNALFMETMKNQELEKMSIDDVQKLQWEALEGEIAKWIKVVKHCTTVLFPGERNLCGVIFSDYPSTFRSLFTNLARAAVIQFIDFAEAVALTKRSAEKLFKFLDMYETLHQLIPAIDIDSISGHEHELKLEISAAAERIGEAAVNIFCDLENSIRSDAAKTPVPGGAVHPLTRYIMNYLKYACEYKDTLEQIFFQHQQNNNNINITDGEGLKKNNNNQTSSSSSPFSFQLMTVMELLDANLEAKSKLYKDPSLRDVFLMNNGRYILQKIKGSIEIHQLMGDTWCRRRSVKLRHYHKNYQRETWGRLLQCLKHEGLHVNGKVYKPVLKERFKNFNTMFDEIHKTQATWVVSDEQLQSELRVSISAVVIPAYRSFLGRFRQYLESGRQAEKYIRYQPEDIEALIEEFFDGNPTSMGRRRT